MIDERKIDIIKKSRPFKVLDIAVFLIVITAVILLVVFSYREGGEYVYISANGENSTHLLREDKTIYIVTSEGELVLEVVISNKEVYVKNATCKDKICENVGKIKYINQTIVCSPSGVVVKIIAKYSNDLTTGAR